MGERLQPLYVTIRAKLANCLVNWDPTDRSAKLIIEPWRDVFSKGEMEAFLIKAICPKLKMALHLMPIDSSNTGIGEVYNQLTRKMFTECFCCFELFGK